MCLKTTMWLYLVWCSMAVAVPLKKIIESTHHQGEAVTSSSIGKPIFSLGLGPLTLQLGLQHWPHPTSAPTGHVDTMNVSSSQPAKLPHNTLTVIQIGQNGSAQALNLMANPSEYVNLMAVPSEYVNVTSGQTVTQVVQPVPVMPSPGQIVDEQSGGQFIIITETIDPQGNVVQSFSRPGQEGNPNGQFNLQPGQTTTTVVEQSQTGQQIAPGQTIIEQPIQRIVPQRSPTAAVEVKKGQFLPGNRRGVVAKLTEVVVQRDNTKPIITLIKGR